MRCDRCGRENPEHLTFCEDCGYNLKPVRKDQAGVPAIRSVPSLPAPAPNQQRPQAPPLRLGERQEPAVARSDGWQACPICQTRNQPGHRFCVACGGPLQAKTQASAPAPTAPATTPMPGPATPAVVAVAPAAGIPSGTQLLVPKPAVDAALAQHKTERQLTNPDGAAAMAVRRQGEARSEELPAAPVVSVEEPPAKAPVSIPCPRCRTVAEEGAAYCRVCGQSLGRSEPVLPLVPSSGLAGLTHESLSRPLASGGASLHLSSRTETYAPQMGGQSWGKLVQLAKDGSDGSAFPIQAEQLDIGSREGDVVLKEDPYVSPRHARLSREGGRWYVVDLGSTNGIYLKLQGKRPLADGDLILLGQQVLRFEVVMEAEQALRPALQHGVALFGTPQTPRFARLCQRTVEGITRDVYYLYRSEVSMGRETADIVFADDPFLSRRHAVLRIQSGIEGARSFTLEDAGSSNGTFVAIRGRERLFGGEVLRIGLHLFRVELTSNEQGGLS
ncbi:MAG: FHA domain-containing protein [Myxococcales bacterium]|nr:FHA domain-containing protein [Polyangiaceae bacterium]MDW8247976.1 FHA domain-containing protein [Myxococcales bacterium]